MEGPSQSSPFQSYVDGMISGEFDDKTRTEIAARFGVDRKTIWNWDQKIDWERVKSERRRLYSAEILGVDQAMLKSAKRGDVQAAKVVYERFDGWIPTSAVKNIQDKTDEELLAEAQRLKAEILNGSTGQDCTGTGAKAA